MSKQRSQPIRERRLEIRITEHDVAELRKLRAYLGQAARLDCSPRSFTTSEAVRTAVRTVTLEFERQGFPDNPRFAKGKGAGHD